MHAFVILAEVLEHLPRGSVWKGENELCRCQVTAMDMSLRQVPISPGPASTTTTIAIIGKYTSRDWRENSARLSVWDEILRRLRLLRCELLGMWLCAGVRVCLRSGSGG